MVTENKQKQILETYPRNKPKTIPILFYATILTNSPAMQINVSHHANAFHSTTSTLFTYANLLNVCYALLHTPIPRVRRIYVQFNAYKSPHIAQYQAYCNHSSFHKRTLVFAKKQFTKQNHNGQHRKY